MFENYVLWLIMGVFVGMLGYIFDLNKHKGGLIIYLVAGTIGGFSGAFIIHFLIWTTPATELNLVATIFGGIFAFIGLRMIDRFYHL